LRVLYITAILFITDQISKLIIKGFKIPFLGIDVTGMNYGQSIKVIGDFFKITFVENPGMAFGISVGVGSKLLLSLFSLVASIGILYYLYKSRNEKLIIRIALALILAGALGNLVDRTFYGVAYGYAPLFYGKVVDFLNVEFWDFTLFGHTYERWPIFNIADASVTIGVILLIIFHHESELKKKPEEVEEENEDLASAGALEIDNADKESVGNEEIGIEDKNGEDNIREEV
jgi:signal peptidase II